MFAKFAKVKEYFAEFLVAVCLLTGLLYAVTTAYQTSYELKQSEIREFELKQNIKAIRGALFLVMSKTEGITDEQIRDFIALKNVKEEKSYKTGVAINDTHFIPSTNITRSEAMAVIDLSKLPQCQTLGNEQFICVPVQYEFGNVFTTNAPSP